MRVREIKFRGITFKGDWVYGDLTNDASGLSFNEAQWIRNNPTENRVDDSATAYWRETTKRIHWREGKKRCNAPVKTESVGQYTGLKDKNGKEIYEGDIVKALGDVCLVYYSDAGAGFKYQKQFSSYEVYNLGNLSAPAYEVIGNIYENPELLEGEE